MNTTMNHTKESARADYEAPLGIHHHESQQPEEEQELSKFLIAGIVIGIALMLFGAVQFLIHV